MLKLEVEKREHTLLVEVINEVRRVGIVIKKGWDVVMTLDISLYSDAGHVYGYEKGVKPDNHHEHGISLHLEYFKLEESVQPLLVFLDEKLGKAEKPATV